MTIYPQNHEAVLVVMKIPVIETSDFTTARIVAFFGEAVSTGYHIPYTGINPLIMHNYFQTFQITKQFQVFPAVCIYNP